MGKHKLALGIHQFCFPGGLGFLRHKAMSFVALQVHHGDILYFFIMILFSMLARAFVQPPHGTRVDPFEAGRPFEAVPFGQMLGHGDRLFFGDFAVP